MVDITVDIHIGNAVIFYLSQIFPHATTTVVAKYIKFWLNWTFIIWTKAKQFFFFLSDL